MQERKRFTTDEVMCMLGAGVLSEDEHVQLLDGDLRTTKPTSPSEAFVVTRLGARLHEAYRRDRFFVNVRLPLWLGVHDLPEPDVTVVRGRVDSFDERHPDAGDAVVVVEVLDRDDRLDRDKVAAYARAGVAVHWRISIRQRQLEVHELPLQGHYAVTRVLAETDRVPLPGLRGRWPLVSSFLPARKRARRG